MDAKELAEVFVCNIESLPIQPITISTPDGPLEVDALILGGWALNQNRDGWTVTQRKSGYAGRAFPTPIEALISLGIYLGAGMPSNFTVEGIKEIPGIREIVERMKVALAVVDSWDLDINYSEPDYSEDV